MTNRYFYRASFKEFVDSSEETIFGHISINDYGDSVSEQKYAWSEEIKVLKKIKKDVYRYLNYNDNIANGKKLTKAQQDWYLEFQKELANHH